MEATLQRKQSRATLDYLAHLQSSLVIESNCVRFRCRGVTISKLELMTFGQEATSVMQLRASADASVIDPGGIRTSPVYVTAHYVPAQHDNE